VRAILNGLLRGSRPVMVLALLAVVGVSGTAYAKLSPANDGKQGSAATGKKAKDTGSQGQKWHKSHKKHPANAVEYGVATVNVSRGGAPATAWATYSTALGSPVGDTTGGVFRFTCATDKAPCTVSVKAAVLSHQHGTAAFYPRVLIYRQDYDSGGPEVYCEYGDGSTGSAAATLTKQALSPTPAYVAVPINIGGSADCKGPDATAGDLNQITVPSGYYDVHSTFVFVS
jgi:hypothetical protein